MVADVHVVVVIVVVTAEVGVISAVAVAVDITAGLDTAVVLEVVVASALNCGFPAPFPLLADADVMFCHAQGVPSVCY